MERLTKKFTDGGAYCEEIIDVGIKDINYPTYVGRAVDKLAEYEDLEEQGKLLKLFCEVGDTVYVIPTRENGLSEIIKMKCLGFSISDPTNTFNLYPIDKKNCTVKMYQPDLDDFGKTVFLTKSAAEQALKEMELG